MSSKLTSKSHIVGPQRDMIIPGLPTLDQTAVSNVASTLNAATPPVDMEQSTGTSRSEGSKPFPPFSVTGSASLDRLNHEARCGPPSYPNLGDVSTSLFAKQHFLATPTYLRTEKGTSPPSPTSLGKEKVDKAGVVSRHGFRISPPAQGENSDADDEGADDELNTESDLETHADDEAYHYTANPEEDDEGHRVLRSQFKSVAIRKRAHAEVEVEESEEEKEGSESGGSANKEAGDDGGDGSQVQKTSVLPMTEQEKGNGRCGKKARTVSGRSLRDVLLPPFSSPAELADSTTGEENSA